MTMRGASAAKTSQRQAKDRQQEVLYDRELEGLPPELRWREWMLRVEAVIFASSEPVSREMLARLRDAVPQIESRIPAMKAAWRASSASLGACGRGARAEAFPVPEKNGQ